MKKFVLGALIWLFATSSYAAELTCGFADTFDHQPERYQIVRQQLINGYAELHIQYKDLTSYKASYSQGEEKLDYDTTVLDYGIELKNSINFPYNSYYTLIAGIYDPEVSNAALHCWLENL